MSSPSSSSCVQRILTEWCQDKTKLSIVRLLTEQEAVARKWFDPTSSQFVLDKHMSRLHHITNPLLFLWCAEFLRQQLLKVDKKTPTDGKIVFSPIHGVIRAIDYFRHEDKADSLAACYDPQTCTYSLPIEYDTFGTKSAKFSRSVAILRCTPPVKRFEDGEGYDEAVTPEMKRTFSGASQLETFLQLTGIRAVLEPLLEYCLDSSKTRIEKVIVHAPEITVGTSKHCVCESNLGIWITELTVAFTAGLRTNKEPFVYKHPIYGNAICDVRIGSHQYGSAFVMNARLNTQANLPFAKCVVKTVMPAETNVVTMLSTLGLEVKDRTKTRSQEPLVVSVRRLNRDATEEDCLSMCMKWIDIDSADVCIMLWPPFPGTCAYMSRYVSNSGRGKQLLLWLTNTADKKAPVSIPTEEVRKAKYALWKHSCCQE